MTEKIAAAYVVIGNPIAHSKSPDIHAHFAAETGQDMRYARLLAPLDGFVATVQEFIGQGGRGANVTVPFKLEAYALANSLTARAQAAGAVNTLKFDGGDILGDNTDGVGLVTDIADNGGFDLAQKKILLLGAGGAARGVLLPLLERLPAQLTIANRAAAKAQQLAQQFQPYSGAGCILSACGFAEATQQYDLVINATSASLQAELPPLAASVFGPATLAYDMMYGPQPTIFMQFAASHGARVRDGLGMLVEQAAESFFIWRGVRPRTDAVFAALRAQL